MPQKKVLSVFSLVMINVIAVDSLRSLPISAEYGSGIIFFYLIACLTFFIPTALASAELATGWPTKGGMYVWVREAFGKDIGFIVIWLQWIYNVVWYPTILSFIAATIAFLFNPQLADDKYYLLISTLAIFWLSTLVNSFGMRTSSIVSALGAIGGTILPMVFIIILGFIWYLTGKPVQINYHWHSLIPNFSHPSNLTFYIGILFGLIGIEMSAMHADEVKNPKRDYPRALLYSTIIIFITLLFSSLSISSVIPHNQISLVSGLIKAFSIFLNAFHLTWCLPIVIVLIVLGGFSAVSAWIIGPTKGLLVATEDGSIPVYFRQVNKHNVPKRILLLQGLIFTILCSVFLLIPSVNGSYWLLTAMTAQIALLEYISLFLAVIYLRYKKPNIKRTFTIPGGKVGLWTVGLLGTLTCLFAIFIGFFPPSTIKVGSVLRYETILAGGTFLLIIPPIIMILFRKILSPA